MLDPICIRSRSAQKSWQEAGPVILAHLLASRLDPFGQNQTQSVRTKSAASWFCTLWSRLSVEERNLVWKWEIGSGPSCILLELGPENFAYWLAARPDAFGPNLTRPSGLDPGRFCTIWCGPSLEEWSRIRWRKLDPAYTICPDSGCTLAVTRMLLNRIQHVYWGCTISHPQEHISCGFWQL